MEFINLNNEKVRLEPKLLKDLGISERNIQEVISENPKLLGLGNLKLIDKERIQSNGDVFKHYSRLIGNSNIKNDQRRLDFLFQKLDDKGSEINKIYEVEIQRGKVDSHLGRVIEYWYTEKAEHVEYNHCAVIVAEHFTCGSLILMKHLNGVSIIAKKMTAYEIEKNKIGLQFEDLYNIDRLTEIPKSTKKLENPYSSYKPIDRKYWENEVPSKVLSLLDTVFSFINEIDSGLELNYTRSYIGLKKNKELHSFVFLEPKKKYLIIKVKLNITDEIINVTGKMGLDINDYKKGYKKITLTEEDIENKEAFLRKLLKLSYDQY